MSERSIFLSALDITDLVERAAYLDQACRNSSVRREVDELLAAHAKSGTFMPGAAVGGDATRSHVSTEGPGTRVGQYKLLEVIGEGGMGTVFMAEQAEPVRRMVAVKIIREGMDSKAVLARFEAERQALALMDHPNIARVLDAGTTGTGRPYFVMELVKGVPITKYCDDHQLPLRERLGLFVPVCQAIQHAHQKGVIHRDVKPSNVLVAQYDDHPVPKVIDFGVAKATGQKLTDQTMFTAFGAVVGTLEYMSPEQAKLNQLDVDTRSDVYSLGVLLYELLTGTTPLTRQRLKSAALDEVLRLIREEEPERPSTRLGTAHSKPEVAAARKAEPARLGQLLRGELDWIVLKALEKDRTRRYETANGLAKDVQRFLADEAVEACPPTVGYRLRKVYRKNRPAVLAAAAFIGLLATSVVTTTVLAVQAHRSEEVAVRERVRAEEGESAAKDQRDRAEWEQKRAEEEKRAAEAVRAFLQDDLLRKADPMRQADTLSAIGDGEIKPNPTINELLDRAAAQLTPERIEAKFPAMPFVQAEVLHALAHAYSGIYKDATAVELIDRAIPLYRTARGPDDIATLNARVTRATLLQYGHRGPDAEKEYAAVVADLHRVFGAKDRLTFEAEFSRALNRTKIGLQAKAVSDLQRLSKSGREYFGPDDKLTLLAEGYLPYAYRANRQPELALRTIEAFRASKGDVKAVLRADHPLYAGAMGELSEIYKDNGLIDESIKVCREVIEIWEKKGEPYHANTGLARYQLGWRYFKKKDYSAATREFAGCLKAAEVTSKKASALDGLRMVAQEQGKLDEALDHAHQALALTLAGRSPAERSWSTGKYRVRIGQVLLRQKKHAEAESFLTAGYQELIDNHDRRSPLDGDLLREAEQAITALTAALGKPDEAKRWFALRLPLHEQAVRRFDDQVAESRESLEAVNTLAHAYVTAGKTEPLVALFERTLARLKAKGCPADDRSITLTSEIGRAMRVAGRPDQTRQVVAAVHEGFARRADVPRDVMARACFNLGYNLTIDQQPGNGVPHLRESLRLYQEVDRTGWQATFSKIWLGTALLWDGKHDEAEKTLLEAYAEAVERRSKAPNWQKNYPEATAGRLATLYETLKRPDDAAKWKALSEKK